MDLGSVADWYDAAQTAGNLAPYGQTMAPEGWLDSLYQSGLPYGQTTAPEGWLDSLYPSGLPYGQTTAPADWSPYSPDWVDAAIKDPLGALKSLSGSAANVKSLASLFGLGNNPLVTGGLGALQVLSSILGRNATNASNQGLQSSNRSPYYSAPLSPISFAGPGRGKTLAQVRAATGGSIGALSEMSNNGWYGYARGGTAGQDDKVPAMLSHGEYVIDADTVAALGDGNNEAGAGALDRMRENVRRHKRSAPPNKIPPKAKAPEQYLKGAK